MKFTIFFSNLVLIFAFAASKQSDDDDKLPLETILSVDTTAWKILDSTPVNTVVKTIRQDTMLAYPVEFLLEKGADISYSATSQKPLSLPFAVNTTDGRVFLKESLKGRVFEKFLKIFVNF
jgi:hypothetical protein